MRQALKQRLIQALFLMSLVVSVASMASAQIFGGSRRAATEPFSGRVVIIDRLKNTPSMKDGKAVLISKPFTPPYDPADYPDTRLFFPYWALNLEADNPNKMKFFVVLTSGGKELARSVVVDIGLAVGKVR